MRRGTTPTYTIEIDCDMNTVDDICLAFYQKATEHGLYLHSSDGDLTLALDGAYATLTQEQTNAFRAGKVGRQVKIKFTDGTVWSSDIEIEDVIDVLHEEVL